MISVGNDIVTLGAARDNRFITKEYYSKILSPKEQYYFDQRPADKLLFIHYVWLLWSIKESVYKYFKRLDNDLLFNPLKIIVENIDLKNVSPQLPVDEFPIENVGFNNNSRFIDGIVNIQGSCISTRSLITESFVFSVVFNEASKNKIHWGIQRIDSSDYKTQSDTVRVFSMNKLTHIFPEQDIVIEKNKAGIPEIVYADGRFPVSFSHHENHIAYSFILPWGE